MNVIFFLSLSLYFVSFSDEGEDGKLGKRKRGERIDEDETEAVSAISVTRTVIQARDFMSLILMTADIT